MLRLSNCFIFCLRAAASELTRSSWPSLFASAELAQDASQRATSPLTTSRATTFTQDFCAPGLDNIRPAAFCLGSSKLPVLSFWSCSGGLGPAETVSRLSSESCGYVHLDECCMIDPNPGETLCDCSRCALRRAPPSPSSRSLAGCRRQKLGVSRQCWTLLFSRKHW